jgi:hypothetical protein
VVDGASLPKVCSSSAKYGPQLQSAELRSAEREKDWDKGGFATAGGHAVRQDQVVYLGR